MPQIPEPGQEAPELESLQTGAVAELPEAQEPPEAIPYKISFEDYKSGECEIDGLNKPNAGVALKLIRDIGINLTDGGNLAASSRFINDIRYIQNQGDYGNLYRGLAQDIEIREIKCKHENRNKPEKAYDFRLFFYTLDAERTFYVLAVRQSHYDTDKGRH
jgi:hypothetical protein